MLTYEADLTIDKTKSGYKVWLPDGEANPRNERELSAFLHGLIGVEEIHLQTVLAQVVTTDNRVMTLQFDGFDPYRAITKLDTSNAMLRAWWESGKEGREEYLAEKEYWGTFVVERNN